MHSPNGPAESAMNLRVSLVGTLQPAVDTKTDTNSDKNGKVWLSRFKLIAAQNWAFLPRNRGEKRPILTVNSSLRSPSASYGWQASLRSSSLHTIGNQTSEGFLSSWTAIITYILCSRSTSRRNITIFSFLLNQSRHRLRGRFFIHESLGLRLPRGTNASPSRGDRVC
jgi:hypothetical protein